MVFCILLPYFTVTKRLIQVERSVKSTSHSSIRCSCQS